MTFGMAMNSDADIDAKREMLSRLQDLVSLSTETGLWFNGRSAAQVFSELCEGIKDSIEAGTAEEEEAKP